jgi:hypothetical protein
MVGNIGFYSRPKRRVYVLRGFDGCEPKTFTKSAPIAATYGVGEANEIKSGDVVSIVSGEWVRGAQDGVVPFIALSDASDTDVKAAGKLPALSCAGKFEIETHTYDSTQAYVEDSDTLRAGLYTNQTEAAKGVTSAAAGGGIGANVIGIVSKGVVALNGTKTGTAAVPGQTPATPTEFVHPQQENILGPVSVLNFITNYQA